MKRMKKAVLNKAEGRTAHKFQFELTLIKVGALDRVLKGLDGSTLFVQEWPSKSNTHGHSGASIPTVAALVTYGCILHDTYGGKSSAPCSPEHLRLYAVREGDPRPLQQWW